METPEHLKLGNRIRYVSTKANPYLSVKEDVLHVTIMRHNGLDPEPVEALKVTSGEIVSMAGDYFTKAGLGSILNIPTRYPNETPVELGGRIIADDIEPDEINGMHEAYADLSALNDRELIDKIFKIEESTYFPQSTINSYIHQLIFYFKVKDYGKKLTSNNDHFMPWSIRAYIIGHSLALKHARLAYHLNQLANDETYSVDATVEPENAAYIDKLIQDSSGYHAAYCQKNYTELSHRHHALAVGIELFAFHFYSDGFASGHMSRMGFLRQILSEKFGDKLGGLLVNCMHNEDNENGITVDDVYDTSQDNDEATTAQGDGEIDSEKNKLNLQNCVDGMTLSLHDIERVCHGAKIPKQQNFGGFEKLPDIDLTKRQTQPMFVLYQGEVYVRENIKVIKILSPTQYDDLMREDPSSQGYRKITGKLDALQLAVKLKAMPFVFKGKIAPLTDDERANIEQDEANRASVLPENQDRKELHTTAKPNKEAGIHLVNWRRTKTTAKHAGQHYAMFKAQQAEAQNAQSLRPN